MSCACENQKMGHEIERFRRLAKAWAQMEEKMAIIYKKPDGTYGFCTYYPDNDKDIVEFITPY